MRSIRTGCAVVAAAMFLVIAGCGGGGGGSAPSSPPPVSTPPPDNTTPTPQPQPDPTPDPPPATVSGTVTYESTNLTFSTPLRNSKAAEQRIAFTINGAPSGELRAFVKRTGRTLLSPDVVFTNGGGYVRFEPDSAARLNLGTNTDTVTITICLEDSTCQSRVIGQPQTFNVTYNVTTTVQGTTVTPFVAAANVAGSVILRGRGFTNATSVRFGATPASSVTVVSDTEIRASYPALAPGQRAVTIDGGAVNFSGTLTSVTVPSYAAALVPFSAEPYLVASALYDTERNALLVVTQAEQTANNQLVKFAYNGTSWSLASATTMPGLQDIALLPGGMLLAATTTRLIELNASTFVAGTSYTPPGTAEIQSIALANDGYLIVTTTDFAASQIYLFSMVDHTFAMPDAKALTPIAGSSQSGSFVGLVQGERSAVGGLIVPQYDASAQLFSGLSGMPSSDGGIPFLRASRPAFDFLGTVMLLNTARFATNDFETNTVAFRTNPLQRFGQLPAWTHSVAIKPNASRAYGLKTQFGISSETLELRTYDVPQLTQVGAGLPIGVTLGDASLQTAMTPNGETLFIVGSFGMKVQPLPN